MDVFTANKCTTCIHNIGTCPNIPLNAKTYIYKVFTCESYIRARTVKV